MKTETVIVNAGKSLHKRAAELAKKQGISLEEWCVDAIKQQLGLLPPDDFAGEVIREIEKALNDNATTGTKVLTLT